eukprot:CAMPEP_0172908148 /NCGR_PEP_ID=MMETSP1075-20121228/180191_1 /TAXON_ID=2916 /ORGANISM="Ceratium fusus, Strain PA161109" /LENGTH=55 /DNA_ID=CAMNT_0013765877 /DNA_START=63 /DNA_END=230 /DNA_ORIENTATION=-
MHLQVLAVYHETCEQRSATQEGKGAGECETIHFGTRLGGIGLAQPQFVVKDMARS